MYSLRMSFWVVPETCRPGDALLLGRRDVQREQDRRRGVDRHRGADLAQRDAREQGLHVGERARSARRPGRPRPRPRARRSRSPSGSAGRTRPTGRSGPARAGSGTARWSRRRSRTRRTGASSRTGRGTSSAWTPAGERVLAGQAEVALAGIEPGEVGRRVDVADRDLGGRRERLAPLGATPPRPWRGWSTASARRAGSRASRPRPPASGVRAPAPRRPPDPPSARSPPAGRRSRCSGPPPRPRARWCRRAAPAARSASSSPRRPAAAGRR